MTVTTTTPGTRTRGTRTTRRTDWSAADARGPRRHQADAAAGFTGRDGRRAVAVADGVGDSPAAARAARIAADHAVRTAVLDGRADLAVLAARDVLLGAGLPGDAALTVALGPDARLAEPTWTVAWVGDVRALAVVDGRPQPLTRDHSVGAAMRAAGVEVAPRMDHVLTTSVRTVRGAVEIGLTVIAEPDALVLATDGVHRALDPDTLAGLCAAVPAAHLPRALVAAATAADTHDNATALVVVAGARPVVPEPRRG
ncbi:serine/threonine protein phosphatase [Actinomycetospora termitidis]|uniref:Serine/threonine protein phosphatase n=1 Tax=Actinomycetospora termitidis TaxID=3053470 RepID=A0ABT7M144_9PSEU|nr:serine/threonine protein phosphatase [Actinomycetospora sp. Odt1-22]MDL5154387.1 serine/threonine protein phosphatase [Actinomycetospora sp. Odt1-22]